MTMIQGEIYFGREKHEYRSSLYFKPITPIYSKELKDFLSVIEYQELSDAIPVFGQMDIEDVFESGEDKTVEVHPQELFGLNWAEDYII